MPHVILKHSHNIPDINIDYQSLFGGISDKIAENAFCDPKSIKCYLQKADFAYLPLKDYFIHIEFMILKRDNLEVINEKVGHMAGLIKQHFPKTYAMDSECLTIEVRHMDPINYHKGKIC